MRIAEVDCTAAGAADAIAVALTRSHPALFLGLGRRAGQAWPPAEWGASGAALLSAAGGPSAAHDTLLTCMASDEVDAATGVAVFRGDAEHAREVDRRLTALLDGGGRDAPPATGSPAAAVYLAQAPLPALLPAPPPPLLAAALERMVGSSDDSRPSTRPPTLWLAPPASGGGARGGSLTSVHTDDAPAVLVVLSGGKTIRTVAPGADAASAGIRPRPPWGDSPHHAAEGADLGARPPGSTAASGGAPPPPPPLLAARGVREAVLGPGDALFLPGGVWHQVGSAPGTAALSFALEGGAFASSPSPSVLLRTAARGVVEAAVEAALAGLPGAARWVGGGSGGQKRAATSSEDGEEEGDFSALAQDDAARLLRSPLASDSGARAPATETTPDDPLGRTAPVTAALAALPSAAAVQAALLAAARACPAALAARLGGGGSRGGGAAAPLPTPPLPPAAAALVARALDAASPPYLARLAAALGGAPKATPAMAGLMAARDAFAAGVGRAALLTELGLE